MRDPIAFLAHHHGISAAAFAELGGLPAGAYVRSASNPIDSQSFLLVVAFVVPQLDVRKGEKNQGEEEKGENFYRCERSYGSFERSLRLPDTIDEAEVDAKFDKAS
jgi:Hsp20/alpha crystallin family